MTFRMSDLVCWSFIIRLLMAWHYKSIRLIFYLKLTEVLDAEEEQAGNCLIPLHSWSFISHFFCFFCLRKPILHSPLVSKLGCIFLPLSAFWNPILLSDLQARNKYIIEENKMDHRVGSGTSVDQFHPAHHVSLAFLTQFEAILP